MLAEIIAPKTEEVEMIEVVSSAGAKEETPPAREDIPPEPAAPAVMPLIALQPPLEKTEPVSTAVTLKAPETQEKMPQLLVPEPLVPPEPAVRLTPPGAGNEIVLTPPAGEASVEIFLEE